MKKTKAKKGLIQHKYKEDWKRAGLGIAIIIVLNLFVNVGIYTFYKPATYENYCSAQETYIPNTQTDCSTAGGTWHSDKMYTPYNGWCEYTAQCQENFEDAQNVYNRNVFVILVTIGTIVLIVGLLLQEMSAVSFGLMFGGVLSLFIGTVRYWSDMNDYLRFIILGIVLAVLIAFGVVHLHDTHEEEEKEKPTPKKARKTKKSDEDLSA